MRLCIHRGAEEIGGNCIELEHGGYRIVLDVGLPLGRCLEDAELPPVPGLGDGTSPELLGVIISHPHQDHYGLLPKVHEDVPVYIGEAASRILSVAAVFTPVGRTRAPAGCLRNRETFVLGPFRVTPYAVDHSAFDAYALLIEAGGERLFYSGDLRGHGRTAYRFETLLRQPPRGIDVMLLEGTCLLPDGRHRGGCSEREVERAYAQTCRTSSGMVLAMFSPQNIDRLVSVYKACRQTGRTLVMDLYTAMIAEATGHPSIPKAGWGGVRVFLPKSQRRAVIRSGAFEMADHVRARRIYGEEMRERRGELACVFRSSMKEELFKTGCLEGATAVWSMWRGYLEMARGRELVSWLDQNKIALRHHHSSGHADARSLRRLVEATEPRRLVPIHTEHKEGFHPVAESFTPVLNGTWLECR